MKIEIPTKKIHVCLSAESLIDLSLRNLKMRYPDLEMEIYPSFGIFTIVFRSKNLTLLEAAQEALMQEFAAFIFEADSGQIEEAVQKIFISKGKKLALAESCTGGAIAARLTAQSGSSDYFLGSAVVYSNEMKMHFLNVSKKTLDQEGEVSAETVKQMLTGLFKNTTADYGIAVSGFAGPTGGTPDKPIGTIYAALGERGGEPDVGYFFLEGSRKTIIALAVNHLLSLLWRKVSLGISAMSFLKGN